MNSNEAEASLKEKQQQLASLQTEERALAKQRRHLESEFQKVQSTLQSFQPKKLKKQIRTTGAYVLGKRNRKQLYSKAYKSKQASNDLKGYKTALYNEGFIDLALTDLQTMYKQTNNNYLKQAIAWELALWFANKQTESGAFQAISYVQEAKKNVRDIETLRTMVIIEAECYVAIGERSIAAELLGTELKKAIHPDLYLALANTEINVQEKVTLINEAYAIYDLAGITFSQDQLDYDAMIMKEENTQYVDGPKVSVILPAYKAEDGIQIAIESILGQTWRNLELLIVDDCSPDQTYKVMERYAKQDKRIKLFQTPQNSGPYVARNIALQAATGEFVTVNDADDWSHHDKLRIQIEHLLKHPQILANTSEQARLTEDVQFYRRGNPGKYIFSNMSSFLFRREIVMEKLGFWDTVRFAADGEFVRRFNRQFGEESIEHLQTGPLSFPRQSVSSLTSSSAFGYSGFFMGVRKEYVASFSAYHEEVTSLHYPAYQTERLFPVPAPMIPTYQKGTRKLDLVMMLDMNDQTEKSITLLETELSAAKKLNLDIGIVQKTTYNVNRNQANKLNKQVRKLCRKYDIQVLVYGETVQCDVLIIRSPMIMHDFQKFIPKIETKACLILIDELSQIAYNREHKITYDFRQSMHQIMMQFDKKGRWYPLNESIRTELMTTYAHDIRHIPLTNNNWTTAGNLPEKEYLTRLKSWILI